MDRKNKRRSGVLMHISSLPSKYGIGDMGKEAFEFVDFLQKSKQTMWQVLPLGPTGYGDSPYACFSSFAGNPLFVSLDTLRSFGFLDDEDLKTPYQYADRPQIDYGWVIHWKMPVLKKAAKNFLKRLPNHDFERFCHKEAPWLDDFAAFMAIKEYFFEKSQKEKFEGIVMWSTYWDKDIKLKHADAMRKYQFMLEDEIRVHKVLQFFFYSQWSYLKKYANDRNVKIVGDMPIFVALDSSDAWAHQELFDINENGDPNYVAGVPPDYFSETGQLWGNPLYKWDKMKHNDFRWWIDRIRHSLELFDIVRIDHFRGFEAYWQIPYGEKTAVKGKWVKAPGYDLFSKIREVFGGDIPIIAEDLGVITPEVERLRDDFNLPGMKVMQFAFDSGEDTGVDRDNLFLPHNYPRNSIAYSGTHDNDTTLGWMKKASKRDLDFCLRYTNSKDITAWALTRALFGSPADSVVIPMQDLLDQDSDHRMNIPNTLGCNWMYRLDFKLLEEKKVAEQLYELSFVYSRNKDQEKPQEKQSDNKKKH